MADGVTVHVKWRSVMTEENGHQAYNFPQKFTRYMRTKYAIPAVYRWKVLRALNGDPKQPIYIGQGEDLIQRMQRVLTPARQAKKVSTNRRLHDLFQTYVAQGRSIVIEVVDVEPFELNGIPFGRGTVHDPFKRLALENILLVIAQRAEAEWELLNMVIDPIEKATLEVAKLMKRHPDVVRAALKRFSDATKIDS
jgi:hypothetical protein